MSRIGVRLRVLLLFALVAMTTRAESAERKRVAVVNADPELERSIGIALSPWGVDVVPYRTEPAPGASLPQAAYRAREIALDLGANGVVWVSAGRDDAVLWIYDADLNHIGSRVMTTPPPFDEATSAAVALSVKTLLRTSTVAPEAERFGAKPPPPPATLRVEAAVGARASAPSITPRVGIGLAYWPSLLKERIGIAVTTTGGPGVGITSSSFAARFNDWTLSPALRLRFAAGRHAAIVPQLGVSLHFTSLDGALVQGPLPVQEGRIDASFDAGMELDWRFGHVLDFGVVAGMEYLLRYQRYLVGPSTVLALSPLAGELALRASVGLF